MNCGGKFHCQRGAFCTYLRVFFLALPLVLSSRGAIARDVQIDEWQVPYENSRPRDPYVDGQGRVWFCGQVGGYLAYLVPGTAEFRKFALERGVGPHNLIIDDEGYVWFAANTLPYIGKLDPETGSVEKFRMPDASVKDPHTLVFDSYGDIWFTVQWSNYIGKLTTSTGAVEIVKIPVERARPYGIRVDPDDRPWIVLFGTNKLATVDPQTMRLQLVDLPRKSARPRRVEITADGKVWYGDYGSGRLGRFDPRTKEFREWPMPGGDDARPYGTALDSDENIWIAEGGSPNRLVGFDTKAERFFGGIDIPNSRGAVRHVYFHPPTQEIWFGEDSNYIGRARLP